MREGRRRRRWHSPNPPINVREKSGIPRSPLLPLLFRCQAIPFQFQEAEEGRSISRIKRGGEGCEGRMPR
jgi:hypothetical protein